jgi:hypothetical protein
VVLAEHVAPLPADASLDRRLAPLLDNLSAATGGRATVRLTTGPPLAAAGPAGPAEPAGPAPAGAGQDPDAAAVRAVVPLRDGGREIGALMVVDRSGAGPATVPTDLLAGTADCVTLLLREEQARDAGREQALHAAELERREARTRAELAATLDAERHRLATSVLTGTTRRLAAVTQRYGDFATAVREEPGRAPAALGALRAALDELIDDFRTVVRAVHPSILRGEGVAAALRELADTLPRRVRCTGGFGRRTGWEVESGIYHAAASVLVALPGRGDATVTVRFSRPAGRLAVQVDDPEASIERLGAVLADDARRLAALGGGLRCRRSAAGVPVVDLWLPERLRADEDLGPASAWPGRGRS